MSPEFAIVGSSAAVCSRLAASFNFQPIQANGAVFPAADAPATVRLEALPAADGLDALLDGAALRGIVAVYCPPWDYLVRSLESDELLDATTDDRLLQHAEELLAGWRTFHESLLSLGHARANRVVLINGGRPIDCQPLAAALSKRFGSSVPTYQFAGPAVDWPGNRFEAACVNLVAALAPECLEIYGELEACAELLGRDPEFAVDGFSQRKAVAQGIVHLLVERHRVARNSRRHRHEIECLEQNADRCGTELDAVRTLAEQHRSVGEARAADVEAIESKASALTQQVANLQHENDLLLLQMHQLQDEIERRTVQQAVLDDQLARMLSEHAACGARADTLEQQILQMHQLQEEIERRTVQQAVLDEQLARIMSEHATCGATVAALERQIDAARAERDTAVQASEAQQGRIAALEEEVAYLKGDNELGLLQLGQVQEELEHYFRLYQEQSRIAARLTSEQSPASVPLFRRLLLGGGAARKGIGGPAGLVNLLASRKKRRRVENQIRQIRESGLFDEAWYVQRYPDVASAGYDPIAHYVKFGVKELRNPSPHFDTGWYLAHYPDVAQGGVNPLVHFIKFGKKEGRQPMRLIA